MKKLQIHGSLFKSFVIITMTVVFLLQSCKRETITAEKQTQFKNVTSSSMVLKGYGITNYQVYSPDADILLAKYQNNGQVSNITYTIDPELRMYTYKFSNEEVSFTLTVDDRKKAAIFTSSKQDNLDVIAEGKTFVNRKTKEKLDPLWFTKLNVNYELIFKMMEIVKEAEGNNMFVNSAVALDKKLNEKITIEKALAFRGKSTNYVQAPCSDGRNTCIAETFYSSTQTLACDYSTNTLGSACSNEFCIGYCSSLGCDCLCLIGDYQCWCTAKGRYCTGPNVPTPPVT